MAKKTDKRVLAYIIVGCLIILITAFAIKWPVGNRVLGDEYSSHIYCYNSFRLLSVSVSDEGQIFSFNHDDRYNDTFEFVYDKAADSYRIYKIISGNPMYLGAGEDQTLVMDDSGDGDAFRWRFDRLGNTMYFLMINEECGLALYETEDSRAVLMPVDDGNINMYMRLQ
ncbi:MAG: hypothetical protein K6A37_01790 [Saccharofermentans sp.]|nr:hypothetical protein [Saccharofermentans sp.]